MQPISPGPDARTPLLTEIDTAKLLGVSARTLQTWRYRGGGPQYVRISRTCVRYRREDLAEWIRDRLRRSTSDDGLVQRGSR